MGVGRGCYRARRSVGLHAVLFVEQALIGPSSSFGTGWRPEQATALQYWVSTRSPPSGSDGGAGADEGGGDEAHEGEGTEEHQQYTYEEHEGGETQVWSA